MSSSGAAKRRVAMLPYEPWCQPPNPQYIFLNSRFGILNHHLGFSLNGFSFVKVMPVAMGQLLAACSCRALGGAALQRRHEGSLWR